MAVVSPGVSRFVVVLVVTVFLGLSLPGLGQESSYPPDNSNYTSGGYPTDSSYPTGSYTSGSYPSGSYPGGSGNYSGSYGPNPEEMAACQAAMNGLQTEMNSFMTTQRTEQEAFFASLEASYEEYYRAPNRTDAELEAFAQQKADEAVAFAEGQAEEIEALMESKKASIDDACPDPPEGQQQQGGGMPGVPDACAGKETEMMGVMSLMMSKFMPRFVRFGFEFNGDRMRFSATNPTDDAWAAWGTQWENKGKAVFEEMKTGVDAYVDENGLRACFDQIGGMGDIEVPDFSGLGSSGQFTQGLPAYSGQMQGPGQAAMDDWNACMAETGATEEQCRARVEAKYADLAGDQGGYSSYSGGCTVTYDASTQRVVVAGSNHAMKIVTAAQMIEDFSVRGQPVAEKLFPNGYVADYKVENTPDGVAMNYYDGAGNIVFSMYDSPLGVLNFHTTEGVDVFTVDLLDGFTLTATPEKVAFRMGDVGGGVTIKSGKIDVLPGNELKIRGDATFFLEPPESKQAPELDDKIGQAALDKKIAADVTIGRDSQGIAADSVPFGDVAVNVTGGLDNVTATIDVEDGAGRTVVLKFDDDVFEADGFEVVVEDAATGVEEIAEQAESLDDVLDPTNDGGKPEVFVVETELGQQALVSIAHFSEKRIVVSGKASDSATPGLAAGVVLASLVLLAVGLASMRRLS